MEFHPEFGEEFGAEAEAASAPEESAVRIQALLDQANAVRGLLGLVAVRRHADHEVRRAGEALALEQLDQVAAAAIRDLTAAARRAGLVVQPVPGAAKQ